MTPLIVTDAHDADWTCGVEATSRVAQVADHSIPSTVDPTHRCTPVAHGLLRDLDG